MRKTNKALIPTLILIGGALACASAGAQTMYRCGNAYQAFPCETGQGKVVGSVGSAQSSYTPVSNAECAQRGAESLKIVWAREAGLIRDKALSQVDEKPLSSPQKTEARKLIGDVYNKRGSAPEVRAAIEADCVAEKEKEALAAAMYRPPNSAEEKQAGAGKAPYGSNDVNRRNTVAASNTDKKARCEKLGRRLESIQNSQRAGGSAQEMEELNRERRDIQRSQLDAGC
jgi:hypothetical protein